MLMDAEEGGTIQLAGEGHQETDLQTDIAADKRRWSFRGIFRVSRKMPFQGLGVLACVPAFTY